MSMSMAVALSLLYLYQFLLYVFWSILLVHTDLELLYLPWCITWVYYLPGFILSGRLSLRNVLSSSASCLEVSFVCH